MSYMNSFLNRFNNIMKTTKAIKKWNLTVQKSPSVKIVSFRILYFLFNYALKCFVCFFFLEYIRP